MSNTFIVQLLMQWLLIVNLSSDLATTSLPSDYENLTKMETLVVEDGFTFKTTKTVLLELKFDKGNSKNKADIYYQILGIDQAKKEDKLREGLCTNTKIRFFLDIPIHFEQLKIKAWNDSFSKSFDLAINEKIIQTLKINDVYK